MRRMCGNCEWFDPEAGDIGEGECVVPLPWWLESYRSVVDPFPRYTDKRAKLCECFQYKKRRRVNDE